jgi:hypothetical protein
VIKPGGRHGRYFTMRWAWREGIVTDAEVIQLEMDAARPFNTL